MEKTYAKYVSNEQIIFKYAKGVVNKNGKEFHPFHEIIYIMDGTAKFISENLHTQLKPNTLIIIPSETYHQLLVSGFEEEYQRCVFQFSNIPGLEDLIAQSMRNLLLLEANKQFQFLFNKAIALTTENYSESTNSAILQSVLSLLLSEITLNTEFEIEATALNTIAEKSIVYINEHIAEPITITDIASGLNISVSHLTHTFKKQMNISIYQYILKKRLVLAHHKITFGESATQAALECGFNDYSGFYKQFKKMFKKAPSSKEMDII